MGLRFGCQIITYGDIWRTIQYAVLAEKAGFDIISLPDHLFHPLDERFLKDPPWDVYTLLTAIGLNTSRVKLTPGVSDVLRRHPATIAHIVATLDQLTKGRAVLALGAGEAFNLDPIPDVKWDKPASILEEGVRVIRMLWDSTREKPASFNGRYFKLKDAFLSFKPIRRPPIYIGGYGPRMRRLIGELGDGWIPWVESPKTYRRSIEDIYLHARKAGRNPEDIDAAVMVFTSISRDGGKAKQVLVERTRVALALRSRLLRDLGYGKLADEAFDIWNTNFTREQLDKLYSIADKIPLEAVEAVTVAGTPDEAIDKIEEYLKAGVKLFIALPFPVNFEETISHLEKQVIPYFKSYEA